MTASNQNSASTTKLDPFFSSGFFAKIPSEALTRLAHAGSTAMSHAEFRVFVALCRFRGGARIVNPKRDTLEAMTGMTPNNISRSTKSLMEKGWLKIHYVNGSNSRKVENYELLLPPLERSSNRATSTKS